MDLIDFEDDFADLMEEWQLVTYTAQPDTPAGKAVPGIASNPITIFAMPPQPVNESEIIKDVGGEFVRDLQKTYTSADVNTRLDDDQADRLTFGTTTYEAYKLSNRSSLGNYKKVYLRKIQGDI